MDRLEQLRRDRARARSDSGRIGILFLVLTRLRDYLELQATWEEVRQATHDCYQALDQMLQEAEGTLDDPEPLLELGETVLEELEVLDSDESLEDQELLRLLALLEPMEQELQRFPLAELRAAGKAERARSELLEKLEVELSDDQLEAGHLEDVIEWMENVFYEEFEPELVLPRLAQLFEKFEGDQANYEKTPILASEWTAEVALADELLLDAYACWLDGLESLSLCCRDLDHEQALQSLELLRQGNRRFIQVELLSQGVL